MSLVGNEKGGRLRVLKCSIHEQSYGTPVKIRAHTITLADIKYASHRTISIERVLDDLVNVTFLLESQFSKYLFFHAI